MRLPAQVADSGFGCYPVDEHEGGADVRASSISIQTTQCVIAAPGRPTWQP